MILSLVLFLSGAIISLLERLQSAYKKADFSWKIFWKNNLFLTIQNIIIGFVLVIGFEIYNPDYQLMFKGANMIGVIWGIVGFGALYFWKGINTFVKTIFKKIIGNVGNKTTKSS